MFVVDTNILIYAANEDFTEHKVCKKLLEGWCNQPGIWYITWGIVYEFIRVVTHLKVFQKPWSSGEAWLFVEHLFSSPGLNVLTETEFHHTVAEGFFKEHPYISGNVIFDAHTIILMKEHGIETIYSRNMDFHKFSSIKVIDPLI